MELRANLDRNKLTGTPASIKWARMIRSKAAKTLEDGGVKTALAALKIHLNEKDLHSIGVTTPERLSMFVFWVCQHSLSNPSSEEWVREKDVNVYSKLVQSYHACIEHFKKNKPFK